MIDFQFHRPDSLGDAIELLDRHGDDARLLAGGTALVLQMKQRFAQPAHVIGLRGLANGDGLGDIEEANGALRIGALCTLRQLEDSPLLRDRIPMLAETVSRVATRRIRSMATVGGALVNGDPNQDPPPALIALGATVELASSAGVRSCPVGELFVDYYETDVRHGEVLTALSVPIPGPDTSGAYLKFLPRTADDYATVSVAAVVTRNGDGTCQDVSIVLGAAGGTPVRAVAAEDVLRGQEPSDEAIQAAADTVPDAVDPLDDFRGSADYKREMAGVFVRRALSQALATGAGTKRTMKLQNTCVVPAGLRETWDALMDVPTAAMWVPGVDAVAEDGDRRYRGSLKARVGPMVMTLSGTVTLEEREPDSGRARFLVEASDRRIGGGVRTTMVVQLAEAASGGTEVAIETDTTFMGRLAELGQPVIRRKAQSTIEEFARNLSRELEARS